MNSDTLSGTRKQVYVLLKIFKYLTGSGAKSYECKFAVHEVLSNKKTTSDKIGEAIREVIDWKNIQGKFNSVHQDLKNLGVTKIEIGDNSLNFEGNYQHNCKSIFFILKYLGLADAELLRRAIELSLEPEDEEEDKEDEEDDEYNEDKEDANEGDDEDDGQR